jgi:hypothetical protein
MPKYWHKPITLLSSPAASHAHATTGIQRPSLKPSGPRLHTPSNTAAQAHENNKGTAAGVGPGANGLSQGNAMNRKTVPDCIKERCGIKMNRSPYLIGEASDPAGAPGMRRNDMPAGIGGWPVSTASCR